MEILQPDDEIEKMVQDAEKHAESDKQFQELVTLCNESEQMVHATRKAFKEAGDKLTEEEKSGLEACCNTLEEAVKSKESDKIQEAKQALEEASGKLAQKLYSAPGGAEGQPEGATAGTEQQGQAGDDVVDADFTEVKDDDK